MIFFENQYFFQSQVISDPPITLLPTFDDVPSSIKQFKPGVVYHRHPSSTPLPDIDMSSDSMLLTLRRPIWVTHLPDRYGFSHTSFTATLNTVSIPHSYTQAAT